MARKSDLMKYGGAILIVAAVFLLLNLGGILSVVSFNPLTYNPGSGFQYQQAIGGSPTINMPDYVLPGASITSVVSIPGTGGGSGTTSAAVGFKDDVGGVQVYPVAAGETTLNLGPQTTDGRTFSVYYKVTNTQQLTSDINGGMSPLFIRKINPTQPIANTMPADPIVDLVGLFKGVANFFKSIVDRFLGSQNTALSIVPSTQNIIVGTPTTFSISMTVPNAPIPYGSGVSFVRNVYAATVLTDSNGNVISVISPQEKLTSNQYAKSISFTPSVAGTYYMVAWAAETTNSWTPTTNWTGWTTPTSVANTTLSFNALSNMAPPPSEPVVDIIGQFIANLLNAFKKALGIA